MRGLVAYDSVYGNTKMVAESIAEQIRADGHEATVMSVRERVPKDHAFDFAFVGSPTRIAKMTGRSKRFVRKLRASWGSRPIMFFDTVMPDVEKQEGRWSGMAAQKLYDMAKDAGMNAVSPVIHARVTGIKGPLAEEALAKAKSAAHELLASLKS